MKWFQRRPEGYDCISDLAAAVVSGFCSATISLLKNDVAAGGICLFHSFPSQSARLNSCTTRTFSPATDSIAQLCH